MKDEYDNIVSMLRQSHKCKLCTTCEGNTGFHEPEGLRVCSVPSVARALRNRPEGS